MWIQNTSETDPHSYEATKAVAMKAQKNILRLQRDWNPMASMIPVWYSTLLTEP